MSFEDRAMRFRLGWLGSWALFVIALGAASLAVAAGFENWKDAMRLRRLQKIDGMIAERIEGRLESLRETAEEREHGLERLRSDVQRAEVRLEEARDTRQTIVVSTSENRVYVRSEGKTIFQAICSTGKGTTLVEDGKAMKFETPTGRFRIVSKEENPVWVPPEWHFVEEARKKKKKLVHLTPGAAIDVATGNPAERKSGGVWSLFRGEQKPSGRVLQVKNNTVVEIQPDGTERELPGGQVIETRDAIVVPPYGSPQRKFEKVLGSHRLNIGSGYALHGTLAVDQLGRSVSHGCVRLGDADIRKLYDMSNVGDQVIIY
jgi:lipoprotein-anchoring transpeptidase ErfK/SrfK